MKDTCARVAERIASDEPLNTLRDHIDLCPACGELARIPRLLSEVSHARRSVEPAPGYASRIAARAMAHRPRNRGRTALLGVGLAGAVGVGIAAFALGGASQTGQHDHATQAAYQAPSTNRAEAPVVAVDVNANVQVDLDGHDDAELVGDLSDITDPDRALSFSADWPAIEEKIAAADVLLGTEESK